MIRRLLQLFGLRRRNRDERTITQVEDSEALTPWGRWLAASPGRELLMLDAADADDHKDVIDPRLGQVSDQRALLVLDPISYSFVRDAPGASPMAGSVLVTFGTRADVLERTGGALAAAAAPQATAEPDPDDPFAAPPNV